MVRKGYMLIEVIIMLSILAVVTGLCARTFRIVIVDIPQMHKDIQANVTVSHMLRRLQNDIETAKSLPDNIGPLQSGDEVLLIGTEDGVIVYRLNGGKVTKDKAVSGEDIDMWNVPRADISWKVWKKGGAGYAVEVTRSIKRKVLGCWEKKLKNSHVYFLGIRGACSREQ
ncbi:MAG: hypothetical protein DRP65_01860 [Planctomycetota bacterium]|nr:MAG: hypothetical protein DRP65_01860 [Planctomycetota bacterium]